MLATMILTCLPNPVMFANTQCASWPLKSCNMVQVFVCFTQSVASTRWAIQDQQRISNTPCDNCLIGTMIFCQYLACLCDIAACLSGSDEIRLLADMIDIIAQAIWCS